jgi:penicillin-binding protein 1A
MAARTKRAKGRREPVFDAPDPDVDDEDEDEDDEEELVDHPPARAKTSRRRNSPKARESARPARDRRRSRRRTSSKSRSTSHDGDGDEPRSRGARVGRLIYWGVVLVLWLAIAAFGAVVWIGVHLPPIQSLEIPKRPPSIQIVGLNGHVLATRGDMGGAAIPIQELPSYLPKAFVAIEDRRFYSHQGIDPIGLTRALVANALHRGVAQGGSTITQQLAKNLFLTPERTLTRKLQEIVLALWLEHKFSKNQILDLYLNRVYFGSGAYGIEAAAQRYFGKSARQVTLAEAALLAGLVKSPSRLAPTHNFDAAERRAQTVLAAMADARLISEDTAQSAMATPPRIAKPFANGSANYAADWIMDELNDLIGRFDTDVTVETTIDPTLQTAAEKALVEEIAKKGEKFGVEQGALVAMTPDGAVRALVGGKSYAESQYNRAVAAKRQPGSAFKPFVYLTAIERGLTPDTIRDDRPIDVKGWRPENYAHQYLGPVTLTQALAQSLNTVSVRLTLEFGPTAVVRTAHRLGIASKLDANASIALGTSEVSLTELVSAYAPFANGGMGIIPHAIERVRAANGSVLYARPSSNLGRIIDLRYVGMMNAMMRETLLTGTARKAEFSGWPAAGKTGTSQEFRDAWFVGYTNHLIAGVWLGNDDSSPTNKAAGSGLPVEIWSHFMSVAHQGVPVADLPGLRIAAPVIATNAPLSNNQLSNIPPANVGTTDTQRPQPAAARGLDGWFLDQLFGRR